MKSPTTPLILLGLFGASLSAQAVTVAINGLNITDGGVFGGAPGSVTTATLNGSPFTTTTSDPIDVTVTYGTLDLDGDGTANDSVTFTMTFAGGGPSQRIFNQGIDTGFGNLNNVTLTMTSVTGVTTDLGNPITFDGFIGANVGMGSSDANTRSVDINGTPVSLATPGGGFQFVQGGLNFPAIASVLFDNSSGSGGSIVARSYDLQFTAIPEPSRALLLSMAGVLVAFRRRR